MIQLKYLTIVMDFLWDVIKDRVVYAIKSQNFQALKDVIITEL